MADPTPMIGYGLTLLLDPAGGSSYTEVAGVYDTVEENYSVESVDVTLYGDSHKQFVPAGDIDTGEVTYSIAFDPASTIWQDLFDMMENRTIGSAKIIFQDGSNYWTSDVFVTELSNSYPKNELSVCEVTFKRTGEVTFGSGSGA